ncbi:MAG: hypothetical protein YK1309IOTA_1050002, partial [Marine Group I thaumarchaeote]
MMSKDPSFLLFRLETKPSGVKNEMTL